jgi:hypothetical protein
MNANKRLELRKNSVLPMKCNVCEKPFMLQKEGQTVYMEYSNQRERLCALIEII